jgi:hypothetical protein
MKISRSGWMRGGASRNNERLIFLHGGGGVGEDLNYAWRYDLNAFFANSVNSLSMSMVNFSCCVCCAPNVTREVTAQPTRSAVRMESGVHAGV